MTATASLGCNARRLLVLDCIADVDIVFPLVTLRRSNLFPAAGLSVNHNSGLGSMPNAGSSGSIPDTNCCSCTSAPNFTQLARVPCSVDRGPPPETRSEE